MGATLRYMLILVSGAMGAVLLEPFFSALLREAGIDTSKYAGPVVMFTASLAAQPWFPLVATGVIAATMGVWLHWLVTKFDRRRSSASDAEREEIGTETSQNGIELSSTVETPPADWHPIPHDSMEPLLPPTPLNNQSVFSYLRGQPRVRRLDELIAGELRQPITGLPHEESIAKEAMAFGIEDVSELDRLLIENEDDILALAPNVVPDKGPNPGFCVEVLFRV